MTLTWTNDPQLLDKHPINYNNWETANTLIEQEGLKRVINEDLSFTNLYGIMVRKIDFVRKKKSDRIIARFSFLVITDEQKEQIQAKILLIAEAARDYFYRSINKSILTWRDVLADYLERGAIPFPLFRCAQAVIPDLQLPVRNSQISFTSARGEAFTFPLCITKPLAYLCGVCNGDGNLRNYWVIIVDETKKHIINLSNMLGDLFGKKGHIMQDKGAWVVKLNLLWTARLFNFITDQTINAPKYDSLREPLLFQQLGAPYRNLYWRGVFDSDGSFKNQLTFCSISAHLCEDFQSFLTDVSITNKLIEQKIGGYQVKIPAREKLKFAQEIGSLHSKKIVDFIAFLEKSLPSIQFQGFNNQNLTSTGFFNFHLLPTMSVLGLEQFFKNAQPTLQELLSTKEIRRYTNGKGITIRKLASLLSSQKTDLMEFLNNFHEKLFFQSSISSKIKLYLKPTNEFAKTLKFIVPTTRGATLYGETQVITIIIEKQFSISIQNNKIQNKLLSKYFRTFCVYAPSEKELENKDEFILSWKKDIISPEN